MKTLMNLFTVAFFATMMMSCGSDASQTADADESTTAEIATDAAANSLDQATTDPAAPAGPTTSIEYTETTFDFGEVQEGEKVRHVYKFTNTGSEPLVISNAKGSCGCTVPDWPREPIAVGATSEIIVEFDTKGKGSVEGKSQTKRVTVTANTDPVNTFLTITGKVNKPAGADNPS